MKLNSLIRFLVMLIPLFSLACGSAASQQYSRISAPIASDSATSVTNGEETALTATPAVLPIPPRQQWENANGYCGETSIQSIGLYYGAWISQQIVRNVGGGEILLGENAEQALTTLHFKFSSWNNDSKSASYPNYMVWLKDNIFHGFPAIIAAYVSDGDNSDEYDHIMPATGINAHTPDLSKYDPADALIYDTLFSDKPLTRAFGKLAATRKGCKMDTMHGGCIPQKVDYGTAVTGFIDQQNVILPVRLTVDSDSEPNVSLGEKPSQIHGTVTVSSLTPGKKYTLLRYNDYGKVPENDDIEQYLSSEFTSRIDFTASVATWTYSDKTPINSNESVYYRCITVE